MTSPKKKSDRNLGAGAYFTKKLRGSNKVRTHSQARYLTKRSRFQEYGYSKLRRFKYGDSSTSLLKELEKIHPGSKRAGRVTIRVRSNELGWISLTPLAPADYAVSLARSSLRRYGSERLGKIREIEVYEISE